jgi:RHS repeat-associated protein
LGDLTYEYDKAGNRTKIGGSFARTGIPESVPSTNYNAANQQTTFADKTLTYDDDGNLTSITDTNGTTLYSWNARNQLAAISGPNVNASFVYDGLGRRETKTINNSLTEFLYDGVNPIQETSGATVLANILTGLGIDQYFARNDVGAGITTNFLTDALGSTIALADSAGTVQTESTYEPFGRSTVAGASNTNPFQYTGRENDGTAVYYYRARYYNPSLQRFIGEDPIGFAGGDVNLYAYVRNSPVKSTDPFGLRAQCCNQDLLDCMDKCIQQNDPLTLLGKGLLTFSGGILWKSWFGIRPFGGPIFSVPSGLAHLAGGGGAARSIRLVGDIGSGVWTLYGNLLALMELYCLGECLGDACAY